MNKNSINILVVGLLSTGSSALVDLLREYKNINCIPGEFNDFRAPGLVADQIINNKATNHIDKLTKSKNRIRLIYNILPILKPKLSIYKGVKNRYNYSIVRLKQLNLLEKLNSKITTENSIEDRIKFSNEWINDVGKIGNKNKEFVLFNQALLPSFDTDIWTKVFEPFKLIIVYRDPKDQLAEIIKNGNLYAPFGGSNLNMGGVTLETIYGRDRIGALKMHIDAIKKRFYWIDTLKNVLNNDEILLIDFEGLINNYKKYRSAIESFIGNIDADRNKNKLFFNPDNAKQNIGIFHNYLNEKELELLKLLDDWYVEKIKANAIIH